MAFKYVKFKNLTFKRLQPESRWTNGSFPWNRDLDLPEPLEHQEQGINWLYEQTAARFILNKGFVSVEYFKAAIFIFFIEHNIVCWNC